MTMRARLLLALVLTLGVAPVAAVPMRAQAVAASPSTASGQKAEPQAISAGKRKEAEEGTEAFKKSPMVISLGRMLGMEPATASTVFTWFNFAVLALAVLYALAKALPKTFRGRTQGIQKNLVEARSATEEAKARLSGVEARLAKLDAEIAALKSEAEKDAAADEARIKASVADERERIAHAAEQEIAAAEAHAQRNLREFAAKLAVEQAASRLNLSDDDDSEIVRGFAARLAATGKGGSN
jgi:F-type H+-transporting ATPase subunit b